MLNLNSIMVGTSDPKALAEFYEKVLEKKPDWSEGDWAGFTCGSCFLTIGSHSRVKGKSQNPERIIINFETNDVAGEFARIKKLGATVVAEPYNPDEKHKDMWIATFADSDGNFFQLMSPWKE